MLHLFRDTLFSIVLLAAGPAGAVAAPPVVSAPAAVAPRCADSILNVDAVTALIHRIIPAQAGHFQVEYIPREDGKDVFELESLGDKIILRGNNGVSVSSALNDYLKTYAHCDITWNGTNLNLPDPLPVVPRKIHEVTSYKYRYYFNYTTYTTIWWDWARWEREIDWMALNGINMPLAVGGQNSIWKRVYKSMGFTDKDMDAFFSGPSYFIWFWMGNLDGWGGPLPDHWMQSYEALQQKILARERALGMTPILQAFSGHVPPTFKDKFPGVKLRTTNWEGRFANTYILDPADSMFTVIGRKFLEEQNKTYGTDHYYATDVFNEMVPPSSDSLFLDHINKTVYRSMSAADPQAVWVMQGWLFVDKEEYWKPKQVKAFLGGVPNDKMIVLDLFSEQRPVWSRTEAYYGKPWIWCLLHNFGGRLSMFGDLPKIATEPYADFHDPHSGNMQGIGLTPEAIEQNPVVYELMLDNTWSKGPIPVDDWVREYAHHRYGRVNADASAAWDLLRHSVYSQSGDPQSIITGRPTFDAAADWTYTDIHYDPLKLIAAWDKLIDASRDKQAAPRQPLLRDNDGFRYDLVDVSRQVLANYANFLQQQFAKDYKAKDMTAFTRDSRRFLRLIGDMDTLLATRKDFLLGPWIRDARNWGADTAESNLYEKNARDLITLWGDKDCPLHEYANKQWSGLLTGFYAPRWQKFIAYATECMKTGKQADVADFDEKIKDWEWAWVNRRGAFPVEPKGDPVTQAVRIHSKYAALIRQVYTDHPGLWKPDN